MLITSSVFENNNFLPAKYSCDGENINPPLNILDVPLGTKTLALIVTDPDSPSGNFIHWLVWNIDPNIKEITEDSVPVGSVEGITSWGKSGYGGPCPNVGIHRYFFKILALDEKLDLQTSATVEELLKAIEGHVLDQGEIVGKYLRK